MFTDLLIGSAAAGAGATVLATVLDQLFYRLRLIENDILTFVAAILMPAQDPHPGTSARLVGFLGHLVMGALFGVSVALVLHFSGVRHVYLKGIGMGAVYWLFFHQALAAKFWVKPDCGLGPAAALWQLVEHLYTGLATVVLLAMTIARSA